MSRQLAQLEEEILALVDKTEKELPYGLNIEDSVSFWDKEKLVCRPLSSELTAISVIAWRRGQPFAPAAAKFIQHQRGSLGQEAAQEVKEREQT